uniref:Uncharacterized protein n=1 Tax=Anguilla anguilla TaxID=7936 RepID=A0A0E9PW99_ANGAN
MEFSLSLSVFMIDPCLRFTVPFCTPSKHAYQLQLH